MNSLVTSKWLNENLDNPNLVILDATQKKNKDGVIGVYENTFIKNAITFDIARDFSDNSSPFPNTLLSANKFEIACQKIGINNSSIIVVYDKLGVFSSARVYWMFRIMGHKNVTVLNGGLPDWISQNYQTIFTAKTIFTKGDFKVSFNSNKVKNFNFIKENIATEKTLVVDVRSADRFNSLVPEKRKGLRSGNIPKSINIPYQYVLNNGKFKTNAELKEVLSVIKTEKDLIFSCGSGITACIVYLASELILENKISVYDGSWTEWGSLF